MRLIIFLLTFLSIAACSKEKETEMSIRDKHVLKIDSFESEIRTSIESAENPSIQLALGAVKEYEIFTYKFPDDSLTPSYLFKSAQIFDGMVNDKAKAARLYQRIYDEYPKYKNRAMMLFYQGNALHDMGDTLNAINQLKLFIAKYPDHEFRDDAENLIKFIQMDEEELEKFFK
ncbi:tetratricopeptide repeat protein [Hyphobacterium sp. CCMP332]|nr:tetratricopeptide repeat protein [Hyphobacterium sp. CCMP332]